MHFAGLGPEKIGENGFLLRQRNQTNEATKNTSEVESLMENSVDFVCSSVTSFHSRLINGTLKRQRIDVHIGPRSTVLSPPFNFTFVDNLY